MVLRGTLTVLRNYKTVYSNYYSVLLKRIFKSKKIEVNIRNGPDVVLDSDTVAKFAVIFGKLYPSIKIISINENRITFEYKGKQITMVYWTYGGSEAFTDYNWLNVDGKTVLDVGASIGDSAIWFALNGAKKVVAVEPYPFPYKIMLENIKVNSVSDKITALNCGVYRENTKVKVSDGVTLGGDDLKISNKGVEISVCTLDYIVEKYGPFDVLKMDCEGCEYDAILNSEHLEVFNQIQIEYHYGCEKLKTKLESLGFKVECNKPEKVYNPRATNPYMLVGYLYAYK